MRDGRMVTTRRQCCLGLLAALMAPALVGCGTGSSRPSLVSAKKERELGQEAANEVEQTVGLVQDPVFGPLVAIPMVPRRKWSGLCSSGSAQPGPPSPSPRGSPPWMTKSGTTLWNVRPS